MTLAAVYFVAAGAGAFTAAFLLVPQSAPPTADTARRRRMPPAIALRVVCFTGTPFGCGVRRATAATAPTSGVAPRGSGPGSREGPAPSPSPWTRPDEARHGRPAETGTARERPPPARRQPG